MKKCLTYNDTKTQSVAKAKVMEYCNVVLSREYDVTEYITKLCGVLYYTSVFLIPYKELKDGNIYTIEDSCYYVPGLFKISMHDLLENLGDVCVNPVCATAKLRIILTDCLLPELLDLLCLDASAVVCSLSSIYFKLKGKQELCSEVAVKYISGIPASDVLIWTQSMLSGDVV